MGISVLLIGITCIRDEMRGNGVLSSFYFKKGENKKGVDLNESIRGEAKI